MKKSKKSMFRMMASGLLAFTLCTAALGSYPLAAGTPLERKHSSQRADDQMNVSEQAQQWVDRLSATAEYALWRDAVVNVTPLGPGMHSWLAVVEDQEHKPLGYLVIHAKEEGGFMLGEYGFGSFPLFSEQSLQLSLLQLKSSAKLTSTDRLYVHPFQAAWRISAGSRGSAAYFADAISGEGLPVARDDEWRTLDEAKTAPSPLSGVSSLESELIQSKLRASAFDPYGTMPWLTKSSVKVEPKSYASLLKSILTGNEVRVTVESYNGKLLQVWSVTGYDRWEDGGIYLALCRDEDGSDRRYVPIQLLTEQGNFYVT